MRLKSASCLLAAVSLAILVACGSSNSSSNATSNPPGTPALQSITLSPLSDAIMVGAKQQLKATAAYSDGSSKNVTTGVKWDSSAPSVAAVSDAGLVTAVTAGSAKITATFDSMNGSASFTVNDILVSLAISPSTSSVNVGSALQLTALGTYEHSASAQAVNGVTWSSSDTSVATVSDSGLVDGVKGGTVTITAKSGSLSGTAKITAVPVLRSIDVSPVGPAVMIGGAQKFTATGSYNDGSTQNVTSKAEWTSSDSKRATISQGNQANGVSAGPLSITATVGSVSGETVLNVVSKPYPSFVGAYTFSLSSTDNRGPAFFAGTVNFDGQGKFSGVEDSNTAAGVHQNVAVSGTYVSYPDGRGNIVLNANACHPSGITLRYVLAASATHAHVIEFDGRGSAKGTLTKQDATAFNQAAINGNYVFRFGGIDSGKNSTKVPQALGEVGVFAADGAGDITSGTEDINDYGVVSPLLNLSKSTYSLNSNGRGSLTLINAAATASYAFYVIDSTKMSFIETDAAGAVTGVAELQTDQVYHAANLSGNFAFLLDQPTILQNAELNYFNFEQIGRYDFDGAGGMGGLRDGESMSGAYQVSNTGVNGRGVLQTQGVMPSQSFTDQRAYIFYMVSPTKVFLLQAYSLPSASTLTPATGEADLQSGTPYGSSTLSGSYTLNAFDLTTPVESLMLLNFDGTGVLEGLADVSQNGSVVSTLLSNPHYLYTPEVSGFTAIELTSPVGTQDYEFFLVSPQMACSGTLTPPTDGSLEEQ